MRTCIIGAGITGLATAWQLKRQGAEVLLLEQSGTAGGAIRSVRRGGYLAEEGPNSIQLNSLEIEEFFESIPGLGHELVAAEPAAKKRFIVRGGKPLAVPMGPWQAVRSPLWSFSGKLRVLREPFVAPAAADVEESVAAFVRRRLGDELYRYAINPLVGGIYAGDPERLSLRHAFPKLHALEQAHGGLIRGALAKMREARRRPGPKPNKRIVSFREGLDSLTRRIAEALGDKLRCGVSIDSIRQSADEKWSVQWTADGSPQSADFDRLILTVPAHRLPSLPLPDSLGTALAPLDAIEYPPVSVLSLGYRREQVAHPLDGFGALVPECEGRKILGVLFPSSVFPGRAPADRVLLTVFVGGTRQPELTSDDPESLLRIVGPELDSLLGVRGEPDFVHLKHWPKAIPQYTLGYGRIFEHIATAEAAHPGLRLAGNYRTGISLTYCLEAALSEGGSSRTAAKTDRIIPPPR